MPPEALEPAPFIRFSTPHQIMLVFTVLLTATMTWQARRAPGSHTTQALTWWLAGMLLLAFPLKLWSAKIAEWPLTPLPMHLCDWASIACAVALVTRRQLFAEIGYFWGLSGTLQGLITPELQYQFPHARFIAFFTLHVSVVVAALYLVTGLKIRPRKLGFLYAFGWLQVYTVMAAVTNWMRGENYGFLRSKPEGGSLMDGLGPWPWYILGLEGMALLFFIILSIPFWIRGRRTSSA